MKKEIVVYGRNNTKHTLLNVTGNKYKLISDYVSIVFDGKEILAIDPSDGPFMDIGFEIGNHKIIKFHGKIGSKEPVLIELEEKKHEDNISK